MIYCKSYSFKDKKIYRDRDLLQAIYIKGFNNIKRLEKYKGAICDLNFTSEEPSLYKAEYIKNNIPHSDPGSRFWIDKGDYLSSDIHKTFKSILDLYNLDIGYWSGDLINSLYVMSTLFKKIKKNYKLKKSFNDSHILAIDILSFYFNIEKDFTITFTLLYGYEGSSREEIIKTEEKQIDIAFLIFFKRLKKISVAS